MRKYFLAVFCLMVLGAHSALAEYRGEYSCLRRPTYPTETTGSALSIIPKNGTQALRVRYFNDMIVAFECQKKGEDGSAKVTFSCTDPMFDTKAVLIIKRSSGDTGKKLVGSLNINEIYRAPKNFDLDCELDPQVGGKILTGIGPSITGVREQKKGDDVNFPRRVINTEDKAELAN